MYNGYNSLRDVIQREIESQKSVLNKFPESISRPITQSCSKYLAQFTSFQLPFKSDVGSGPTTTTSASSSSSATSSAAPTASSGAQSSTAGSTAKSQQLGTIQEGGGLSGAASNDLNSSVQSQGATATSGGQTSSSGGHHHHQSSMMMLIPENMIQLETSEQVNWVLENLMYGLTLSHDYQDTIKDCWNVYHDWLCVLLDEPKPFLPQPIRDDPIVYARKMLWHLYHLFVPRKDSQAPTKHIMMCHGVLILIEGIAKDSKLLKRDLWEEFLKFFLAINDAVLAPAFNKDDFGEILSSRIVATLFEIWLIACNRVFPSPSLWRTFQELCANWRHHVSLVIEWNRVCHALTNRLLELTWWPDMSSQTGSRNPASNDTNVAYDIQTIIGQMNIETVIQTWFRFLHIIGRPVDFCDHHAISKMLEMVRLNRLAGLSKDGGSSLGSSGSGGSSANLDPSAAPTANFPCVKRLPIIFLEVIKGISRIVDAFLGQNTNSTLYQLVQQHHQNMHFNRQLNIGSISTTTTSSTTSVSFDQKSRSKSVLVTPTTTTTTIDLSSNSSTGSLASNASNARLNPYRLNRTSVNSLLHLVGQWLFEAASITSKEYILGQAEAYGILCKIFSSVRTNETISLDYLSRFYALLIQGLRVPPNLGELNSSTLEYEGGELLASIIVNGCNLFKLDFDGSSVVLLPMLNALHAVFKLKYTMREEPNRPKELVKSVFNIGAQSVTLVELKRYCIVIFNSLLSMPNHFGQVTLSETGLTYYSLRTKILEIFLAAMTNEQDTVNLQMLFGCGRLIVGEWALDESKKTSSEVAGLDKKERASYCYNQIVSLICAPLKIYNTTLQNHSFALSIFDTLASIAAAGDYLAGASGGEDDSICKLAISWIWHYVKMQIRRRSRDHTREMHSVIVAAYNCLIVLLITKPSVLKDKICLQTVANCIEIGISGSSSYPEQQKLREEASSTSSGNQGGSGAVSSGVSGGGSGKEATPTGTTGTSSSSNNPGGGGSSSGAATSSTSGGAAGGGGGSGSGGGAGGSGASGLAGGSGGLGANSTLLKAEKELKPASLRVKEAAECVLYYLMEHTSSAAGVLSDNSHDLTRVAIDEKSLIDLTGKPANSKFKYFAVDGSLIVAILEKPLVKTPISSLCPTVTIIIRGAFGRQAWSLHLRTNPFSDLENISVDSKGNAIPRALSMMNSMMESNRNSINNGHHHHHHHHHHRHNIMRGGGGDSSTLKPMSNLTNTGDSNSNNGANNDEGKSAPTTTTRPKCELSIPSLSDVAENCVGAQLGRFQKLKEDQIDFELSAINRVLGENETYKNKQFGANYESLLSTKNCNDFQSARMLLSHLGYCSLARDISSSSTSTSDAPEIFSLDGNDVNFQDHLQLLDSLPTRTFSFSTIFYVKANQTNAKSILNNINLDEHLDENFYMFVQSLGSILDVNDLAKRKLVPQPNKDESITSSSSYTRKLSKINGTENILYWSDTSSEICFTIPNGSTSSSGELAPSITPPGDDSNRAKYQSIPGDIRVLIVWLEQFQDADQIPIDELISESATVDTAPTQQQQQKQREVIVIFIHPLKNRLNRVSLWSSAARRHFYTMPLIDGMVVGSKMLSSMVRQTVLNIFRRKRLEIDDYQPPHVKRKNKITEMIKKHQTKKSEPDFFTSLLMGT